MAQNQAGASPPSEAELRTALEHLGGHASALDLVEKFLETYPPYDVQRAIQRGLDNGFLKLGDGLEIVLFKEAEAA